MRGRQKKQPSMFVQATVDSFVPADHPLRNIKKLADEALVALSQQIGQGYSRIGRASIPPEYLLRSQLLMALYGIASERSFCEQLRYNMLYKWFVGLELDEVPFVPTTFTKNRDRFMKMEVGKKLFDEIVREASRLGLLSSEHFSVDGSLIEAAASMKSFRPNDEDDDQDGNGWADFTGKKRSNTTHTSKTDPESRLMRKGSGKEAKLSHLLNVLDENRNGLVVAVNVVQATGTAEREAALSLLKATVAPTKHKATIGADKGYCAKSFIDELREMGLRPHVAMTDHVRRRKPPLDKRTTDSRGYQVSQVFRRKVEGIIGWFKDPGRIKRTRFVGLQKTNDLAQFIGAAHNLLRITNLTRIQQT